MKSYLHGYYIVYSITSSHIKSQNHLEICSVGFRSDSLFLNSASYVPSDYFRFFSYLLDQRNVRCLLTCTTFCFGTTSVHPNLHLVSVSCPSKPVLYLPCTTLIFLGAVPQSPNVPICFVMSECLSVTSRR